MLEILERITRSRRNETGHDALARFKGVLELEKLARVISDTSLCGLGQSAPNPVLSTLRWFRDEYEAHVFERRCPAHACTDLLTFSVDADLCKGCTACARQCPADAISGDKQKPHAIDQSRCVRCGACVQTCKFGAITAA